MFTALIQQHDSKMRFDRSSNLSKKYKFSINTKFGCDNTFKISDVESSINLIL